MLPAYKTQLPDSTSWLLNPSFIRTLILVAAVINGFGAAILWVAQGQYISRCANDKNKGEYNSIFWALFMCSGVVGNLMGAFVVANVKQSTFYTVLTAFCIISSLFFLLLKEPIPYPILPEEVNDLGFSGSIRDHKISEIEVKTTVNEDLKETLQLMFSPRMLKIVPFMMWTAISTAVYAGVFVPLMTDTMPQNPKSLDWDEQTRQRNCLLALVGLGLGEILGSLVLG